MSDNIKVRWSVDLEKLHSASGEVELLRIDWDMLSPEDRARLIRDEVGAGVLHNLDVDWTITNARIDDSNR